MILHSSLPTAQELHEKLTLEDLTNYAETTLPKDRDGKPSCPACGSGQKTNGTSALSLIADSKRYFCHSCGKHFSLIDLLVEVEGLSIADAIKQVQERYCRESVFTGFCDRPTAPKKKDKQPTKKPMISKDEKRHDEYITSRHGVLMNALDENPESELKNTRGISRAVLARFRIGCDVVNGEKWKWQYRDEVKAFVLPNDAGGYKYRGTSDEDKLIDGKKKRFIRCCGHQAPTNAGILDKADKPIWVVEGEFDMLSIEEAGGYAVSMGGTGNVGKLIKLINQAPPKQPIILIPDSDDAGKGAMDKLKKALDDARLPNFVVKLPDGVKDANEYLQADREAFFEFVKKQTEEVGKMKFEFSDDGLGIVGGCMMSVADNFFEKLADYTNRPKYSTGFDALDGVLGGGFRDGVYVVGASSGLGKTSFVLQMADKWAREGQDVIYFSLEVSRFELMTKSISRMMLEYGDKNLSVEKILRNYDSLDIFEQNEVREMVYRYASEVAPNLYVYEQGQDSGLDVGRICQVVERHSEMKKKKPIVIVDYLQYLSGGLDGFSEKDKNKANVLGLKKLATIHEVPIIVVSSVNRESYYGVLGAGALKECGDIEYTANAVMLLQLSALEQGVKKDEAIEKYRDEMKKPQRELSLAVVKNRFGGCSAVKLIFDASSGLFRQAVSWGG